MTKYFKFFLLFSVLTGFAYWIVSQPISWQNWFSFKVLASLAGPVFLPLALGILWWSLLPKGEARKLTLKKVVYIQSIAWIGRYLPAKAGLYLGKLYLCRKNHLNSVAVTTSILYENLFFITSGLLVALFVFSEKLFLLPKYIILITIVLIIFFLPFIVKFLTKKLTSYTDEIPILSSYVTFFIYIVLHLTLGSLHYLFLDQIIEQNDMSLAYVVAMTAAANTLGILAILTPAGLGVREGVYVLLLSDEIGATAAFDFALQSRVWMTIGDIFVAIILLFFWRAWRVKK